MDQHSRSRPLSIATGLILLTSPAAAQGGQQPLKDLDAYIRSSMRDWQVPGLAIAVVHSDSVTFLQGFGVREAGKPATVDPGTVFALSSNSKAFGAAAVGILVDEGKLSWDDPVSRHLPSFQLPDPWVTRQVTLRDLLAHRMASELGSGSELLWSLTALSSDQVLAGLKHLTPGRQRFRDRYAYHNTTLVAVCQVVSTLAGQSWDDFMKARVFTPLGMTSATTSVLDLWNEQDVAPCYYCEPANRRVGHEQARVPNVAMPHVRSDSGPRPIPWRRVDNVAAGSSINANVVDVAKWVRLHLAKGSFGGRRFLTAATVEEMLAPQMLLAGEPPLPGGPGFGHLWTFGLGWLLVDYQGRKLALHEGAMTGWRSGIALLPEENLGVAVLSNVQLPPAENLLPIALALTVFDRYLGLPPRDWSAAWLTSARAEAEKENAASATSAARRVGGTRPSRSPQDLVGEYVHPAFGRLELANEEGALTARLGGVSRGDVEHWHYDVYRITWRSPNRLRGFLTFGLDAAGRVARVEISGLGTFTRAPRS